MKEEEKADSIDTSRREIDGITYRKDLYYINTIIGNGKRREIIVSKWLFYLTWFAWIFRRRHFKKYKGFNVLYEKYV
jgi:hypothetical protein